MDSRMAIKTSLDRYSTLVAGSVVDRLTEATDPAGRIATLRLLCSSIRWAAANAADRWGLTLDPRFVRLNIGQVESVVVRTAGVSVLVAEFGRIGGTSLGDPYAAASGARLRHVPHQLSAMVLPALRTGHLEAMALAARRPCTRAIKSAHSPGLVQWLWEQLHLAGNPPRPTYLVGRAVPATSQRRDARLQADKAVMEMPDLSATEKKRVISTRLAQRLFKQRLLARDRACPVTAISDSEHLRASHIRPWAESSDAQRQDPNNGLVLAPHVDHLFDRGYISFENNGTVLVSPRLDPAILRAWGLQGIAGKKLRAFPRAMWQFLAYHRDVIFKRKSLRSDPN